MDPEVPLPVGEPRGGEPPLAREVYPELVRELVALPAAEGESWPVLGVRDVRLVAPCPCRDDLCQSFATAAHDPGTPYGPGHRCVPLLSERGELVLDVADGRIVHVEVPFRPPLHDARRPAAGGGTGRRLMPGPAVG
ncbi:hypothetical protein [Kitasatospora sp. NPDC088783]|uniref:hypothetical protein n=1 Tax=Kitasatospora sp. NPDC088783 TaxID=3364077 RepID=UPI00381C8E5E